MKYLEQDCVFVSAGQSFESGGAFVSPVYVIAYLGKDNVLTDWHGARLGTYHVTASWPINSYLSSHMNQVYARIDGITYTGRSAGEGMLFKGKRVV
ncbi:hypothetical protein LCGC14_1552240 [marine sediment metagenome]|uniref:Uncharacterized protein n=1 Tax=marine sediment metagenome TaxID=412755 RepID=A0A0F9LQR5_9ZZZZ